jgi:hypothetical protein
MTAQHIHDVIPAQAGIQWDLAASSRLARSTTLDSRLRGNDVVGWEG